MNKPAPTERSFGLSVGGVATVAGAVGWWRGHDLVGPVLLGIGVLLVLFGLVAPRALRVPNKIWWRFAQALGYVNARIILTVFFTVILTPFGTLMRLFGRNPLMPPTRGTSWIAANAERRQADHFRRSF